MAPSFQMLSAALSLSLSQVKVASAEERLWLFSLCQTSSALSALGQCAEVINNALGPRPRRLAAIQRAACHAALYSSVVSVKTHTQAHAHAPPLTSDPHPQPPSLSLFLKGCFSSQSRLPVVTPFVKSASRGAWTTTSAVLSASSHYKRCTCMFSLSCASFLLQWGK